MQCPGLHAPYVNPLKQRHYIIGKLFKLLDALPLWIIGHVMLLILIDGREF